MGILFDPTLKLILGVCVGGGEVSVRETETDSHLFHSGLLNHGQLRRLKRTTLMLDACDHS